VTSRIPSATTPSEATFVFAIMASPNPVALVLIPAVTQLSTTAARTPPARMTTSLFTAIVPPDFRAMVSIAPTLMSA